jgi:DEAD/DEAH box helicase domain-containing protein
MYDIIPLMITEIIFDCETKKLFSEIGSNDPGDLGVSIVSVYKRIVDESQRELSGKLMSFWEEQLPAMWQHFREAKRIIGFNSIKFDVPALARHAPKEFRTFPHFDIMKAVRDQLGFSLGLSHLATHSIGTAKTDVGTNAVLYWNKHDEESLAKLKHYCEADVLLTRDLYDFGVRERKLKYMDKWNTLREIPVDFSYPKEIIDASRQIGLF